MFEGIGEAEVFDRGRYLEEGRYTLEIRKALLKETRKSGNAVIVEFNVLESTDEDAHPIGSKATWFQGLKDKSVSFGSLKDFCMKLVGVNQKKDPEGYKDFCEGLQEMLLEATEKFSGADDTHPWHGMKIKVDVVKTETQKGGEFSRHEWEHVEA